MLYLIIFLIIISFSTISILADVVTKTNKFNTQLVNFISGGIAGTISSTLTIPLEVIKTQLQSSRVGATSNAKEVFSKILKTEGVKGFYKGLTPMLIGIIPTRAIYFWAYSTSKSLLHVKVGDNSVNHLLSAFAAGITSNTIMNPLWMVKTRFQIIADTTVGQRKFATFQDVARTIWKEEGPPGFFKGITASYIGCFEGAIQWIAYEKLKTFLSMIHPNDYQKLLLAKDNSKALNNLSNETKIRNTLSPIEYFIAAAVSKFIAVIATYPHEVVRTRLREQATNGAFKYNTFFGTLKTIAKEEGKRGLYSGMDMHLLRSVPNAAIMFLSFELVSNYLSRKQSILLLDTSSGSSSSSSSNIKTSKPLKTIPIR